MEPTPLFPEDLLFLIAYITLLLLGASAPAISMGLVRTESVARWRAEDVKSRVAEGMGTGRVLDGAVALLVAVALALTVAEVFFGLPASTALPWSAFAVGLSCAIEVRQTFRRGAILAEAHWRTAEYVLLRDLPRWKVTLCVSCVACKWFGMYGSMRLLLVHPW